MCARAFSSAFSLLLAARDSSVLTWTNSSFSKLSRNRPHAGAVHRVAGHQLRMREALVDVLVDDVRLVQDQVALDQDRAPGRTDSSR
jgi:hypothetical protein